MTDVGPPAIRPVGPAASYYGDGRSPQQACDVAVMMVTVLRPSIVGSLHSIFAQKFEGRIQLVIGIDVAKGEVQPLLETLAHRPGNVSALVFHLPYSTARRNGGLHAPNDGGALRTILAASANARWLAQLDDDNEWLPDHLASLLRVAPGHAYAFSPRILVDEVTDENLGIDQWDSVGPHAGRLAHLGGFVDPNCLMIDKIEAVRALASYADTWDSRPDWTADRLLFSQLASRPHARTTSPTVRYRIRRNNWMWGPLRQAKARGELNGFSWGSQLTS